jgi:hypothetical protein
MRIPVSILFLMLTVVASRAETASVGLLTLDIPSGFRETEHHQKDSLGDLDANRWESDDGRVLELLYYADFPKQDRGPMVIADEEAIEVVGQKTKLIETSWFFGVEKKALVVYLSFGNSTYIIDSEHMPKSEFKTILKTLQLLKK